MTQLPILYSRTSTQAIQTWQIIVEGDSYYTIHGQQNGQLQTTMPTVCKPKNEGKKNGTTGEQQALKEANALWKKKKKSGCFEDIKDIDIQLFIKPMRAKVYADVVDTITFPIYSQPKLDGFRCVAHPDSLWSRNGTQFMSTPHITEAVKPAFGILPDINPDGELYGDKLSKDFNKISSLVRKIRPTADEIAESAQYVQYWIYDVVSPGTFEERFKLAQQLVQIINNQCVRLVETTLCHNQEEVDECMMRYISEGYEGQILRRPKGLYEHKRSKNTIKRKEFFDAEYRIVKVIEGEGNKTGIVGAFIVETQDGQQFRTNVKGSHEYLTQLWIDRDTLPGLFCTIQYPNLTPKTEKGGGIPRFPYATKIWPKDHPEVRGW